MLGKRTSRRSSGGLDEASATTFGIDPLETLLFLSLLDNTDRSNEKTQDDSHEAIHGRERILKRVVREGSDGGDAEICSDVDVKAVGEILGGAKCSANLNSIGRVEISTAVELVLKGNSIIGAQRRPLCVEFVALPQGEEPDHAADDGNEDAVDNQEPVEDHEANCNMVPLHDGSERNHKCRSQRYSHHHPSSEEFRGHCHVHQNVRGPPYDGHCD